MPSLWLVDGSHATFRAYHALPHLSTRQGVPTNAVYRVPVRRLAFPARARA